MTVTAVSPSSWLLPPTDLALGPSDAHVWRLSLTPPPEQVALLARTLSHDERERAARFYFDRDRIAFTVARGALRTLTGIYTGHAAQDLVFGYQAKGKPYLTSPSGDLHFNISHSGGVALLAFTRSREIGVDVEHRRPLPDLLSVANFSFSHQEYTTLCGLPAHEQIDAFFSCWSRKEAFIKTTGEGISQIRDFDVSIRPGEPARLLRVKDVLPGHERWSIHDLPAIADYAAALVVEGHDVQITCWDWPPTSPAAGQR